MGVWIWSDDKSQQLKATLQFQKLLSIEGIRRVDKVIEMFIMCGVVPRFVEFLARDDFPQLQFEAAWILANIATSSKNTKLVIHHGAVPIFVKLLSSPIDNIREEAARALANIASDSTSCRDLVLSHGALIPLLSQFNDQSNLSMLRNATWTLFNFCGGKPKPLFEQMRPALPALQRLLFSDDQQVLIDTCWTLTFLSYDTSKDDIQAVIDADVCGRLVQLLLHPSPDVLIPALRTLGNIVNRDGGMRTQLRPALPTLQRLLFSNNEQVLADTCLTLSYLSNGPSTDNIQAVIDAGVCGRLVQLLLHPSPDVLIPALRTLGNIVTGDDMQTQVVIDHGSLPCFLSLLSTHNRDKSIQKEACWTIANITAGNTEQIQAVIEAGLIASLVNLFQNAEFGIKKEVASAFSNVISGGTPEQIKYLVSQGCIKLLGDFLVCPDPRLVMICLEGLENLLVAGKAAEKSFGNTGDDVNLYAQMIDDAEGLEKIKNLQGHDNDEVYERAVKILKTYYLLEDEEMLPLGRRQ